MKLETVISKLSQVSADIKSIKKEIRSASHSSLSAYSKNLLEKDLSDATEKQMKLLMLLVNKKESLGITQKELEKIVKKATK